MDWTTIALIALAILAAALIIWATVFAILARHVMRFQNRVADDILDTRHTAPARRRPTRTRRERGEL